MSLLEVKGVTKRFGNLLALNRIDLNVQEGELVGLVGPNGSGKSTLFNVISGRYHISGGDIIYQGERISGLRPDQIARRGIMRVFQANISFGDVSVYENIMRGCFLSAEANLCEVFFNSRRYRNEESKMKLRVEELLDFWQLARWKDSLASSLPHGLQRVLGIAVAMAPRPKLLLLDEPLTGMSAEESAAMCERIKSLNEQGTTIIMVEHNIKSVMSICHRLVVLNFGQKLAEGRAEEVLRDKQVVSAYLGEEVL
jgi:branched-chain amino acid transport system ATP-binding protein